MTSVIESLKRYKPQFAWVIAICLACLISISTHSIRVGASIPCQPPPVDIVADFLAQQRGFLQVKSILISRSKSIGGSSIRLYFYNEQVSRRSLVTEDIEPGSTESPGPKGELALNVDEFFYFQRDRHESGEGFFIAEDDLRPGVVKSQAQAQHIHWFASSPVIDPMTRRLKGYISLHITSELLPTTRESILDQLSISADGVSHVLFDG